MKRIWAWMLIIASYLSSFGIPLVGAYFFLAIEKVEEAGRGGIFYLIILTVFIIVMFITLVKAVNEMEANLFKSIFRTAIRIVIIIGFIAFIQFIDLNEGKIISFIYTVLGGMTLGSIFEIIVVSLYGDYVREVGVF